MTKRPTKSTTKAKQPATKAKPPRQPAAQAALARNAGPMRHRLARRANDRAPVSSGRVVGGTDPCVCGGAPEDHGRDPEYPGSTACTHCTECIAYEADPQEDP